MERITTIEFIARIYEPRQLPLTSHRTVWFSTRYALSVVSEGLFRKVASSFFHTYVIADFSYETEAWKKWEIER
jgi:hypothetical protein